MKCQILFSRKNITSLSYAEFAHSMVNLAGASPIISGTGFQIPEYAAKSLAMNQMGQLPAVQQQQAAAAAAAAAASAAVSGMVQGPMMSPPQPQVPAPTSNAPPIATQCFMLSNMFDPSM